jgi:hypothetical protein
MRLKNNESFIDYKLDLLLFGQYQQIAGNPPFQCDEISVILSPIATTVGH